MCRGIRQYGYNRRARKKEEKRGTYGTGDRSDEVLVEGSRAVVLEAEDVLLGERRSTEKLRDERRRRGLEAVHREEQAEKLDIQRRNRARYAQRSRTHRGRGKSPRRGQSGRIHGNGTPQGWF